MEDDQGLKIEIKISKVDNDEINDLLKGVAVRAKVQYDKQENKDSLVAQKYEKLVDKATDEKTGWMSKKELDNRVEEYKNKAEERTLDREAQVKELEQQAKDLIDTVTPLVQALNVGETIDYSVMGNIKRSLDVIALQLGINWKDLAEQSGADANTIQTLDKSESLQFDLS